MENNHEEANDIYITWPKIALMEYADHDRLDRLREDEDDNTYINIDGGKCSKFYFLNMWHTKD